MKRFLRSASSRRIPRAFSGTSRLWVADFVWKWAPNGNATRTNFKLQGEYLRSRRDDLVWRVRLGPDWLYLYLLLEFQTGDASGQNMATIAAEAAWAWTMPAAISINFFVMVMLLCVGSQ